MEIKNKTEWNTKDLMKLIRAVAKKEGISLKKQRMIEMCHDCWKSNHGNRKYCRNCGSENLHMR